MIQTFDLGSVKTITLEPAKTLQSQNVIWEQIEVTDKEYRVLLSFGLNTGVTQWLTLFSVAAGNYKRTPTDTEVINRAALLLNI